MEEDCFVVLEVGLQPPSVSLGSLALCDLKQANEQYSVSQTGQRYFDGCSLQILQFAMAKMDRVIQ